jgi:hypothetical protein
VVVHRYGFELHPERIQALVEELPICCDELTKDLQAFFEFLMQLNQALGRVFNLWIGVPRMVTLIESSRSQQQIQNITQCS